jgi:putative nucleotidyltransferase with HDIG domain
MIFSDTMGRNRLYWGSLFSRCVILSGLIIVALSISTLLDDPTGFICFSILAVLSEIGGDDLFRISRDRSISIALVIAIASVLVFGQKVAIWIQVIAGLAAALSVLVIRRPAAFSLSPWIRQTLTDVGTRVIAVFFAGWVYVLSGGKPGDILLATNILPLLLAVLVHFLSRQAILISLDFLQTDMYLIDVLIAHVDLNVLINLVIGILAGSCLAISYQLFRVFGTIVFFLPFVSTGYSIRLYISRMKTYVDRLERLNNDLNEANTGLIETMSEIIDAYDMYTYGHSTQVAVYAEAIAEIMNLPVPEREMIVKASLVHDIGKIGIYDTIISKPGPLSDDEYTIMKQHPVIGAHILNQMRGLRDLVPLVQFHHERWDGKGYPSGLAGTEIPLGARILAVADTVDAMCSDRPNRPTRNFNEVTNEVKRCSGSQFDPEIVKVFLQLAEEKGPAYFLNSAIKVDRSIRLEEIHSISPAVDRFLKKSLVGSGSS